MKLRVALFALAACRSASAPVPVIIEEPAVAPLPPSSGTPIGILLDEQTRLGLRPDQREKLQEIDRRLSTRNDLLAGEMRAMDRPPPKPGKGHAPKGKRPPGSPPNSGDRGRVGDQAAANVRAAIDEALGVLDVDQRANAETILHEHGVSGTPHQEPQVPQQTATPDDSDQADPTSEP